MRILLLSLAAALSFSTAAFAQDFGLMAGVLDSNATVITSGTNSLPSGTSSSGVFGFRAGGVMSIPLTDQFLFRSGLIFTQRHVEVTNSGVNATLDFDYIDIPVLGQFNITENFGVFGGLIAAASVNHSGTAENQTVTGTKALYPLIQVGINGTFQNMFGVEAYYEMGLGDISDQVKNFGVFGANFIYWL